MKLGTFQLLSFLLFSIALAVPSKAQDVITLANPSFEGPPHSGISSMSIPGWTDCGQYSFAGETPPDIHNSLTSQDNVRDDDKYFGVTKVASDGRTFLGMVARDNDSYESVTQRLEAPLQGGKCYTFQIDLCRSDVYISPYPKRDYSKSYTKPIVLRIYGGTNFCNKRQLLAESEKVSNTEWKTYDFVLQPEMDYQYFTIEAFYKVPIMLSYNGNLLLDNASDIVETTCPEDEIIAAAEVKKDPTPPVTPPTPAKQKEPELKKETKKEPVVVKTVPKPEPKKPTINKELDRKVIKKGQIVNIKDLFFEADKAEINKDSYKSLDELVNFLKHNEDIRVEIGGHTNGKPTSHEWCDSLSTLRAEAVAQYLFDNGVRKSQVEAKGYGKRDPIATNKTKEGRARNQRVEIKILEVDS